MRTIVSLLGLVLASTGWLTAQVSLEVVLDQDEFLRNESIPLKVRITNFSGQTLRLGEDGDWLTFLVEGEDQARASRIGDVSVRGEFSLESSQVATRRVELTSGYSFPGAGRYSVTATLTIAEWGQQIISQPRKFMIIKGTSLWEQLVGLPTAGGSPEVRRYSLQQATFLKELKLYLRLSDQSDTHAIRVAPLGRLVSFSRPEAQVDKFSNLHVLFQTGARSFDYCVVSPDGELIVRHRHEYTNTRPVLSTTNEGLIMVSGGMRRLTKADLPPPIELNATNDVVTGAAEKR